MTITVASGTSTPTSMTVVATSTSSVPGPELGHDPLLLGRRQLAVEQPDPQAGQLRAGQALRLGHHRGGLDPVRSLDQRADHEGPVAGGHLGPAPAPTPPRPRAGSGATVVTGSRPGGSSSMMVMSRSPKTTMAAVRGMGVAVMTSRSGSRPVPSVAPALGPEGGPLLHPEAVLLVDDHHPEGAEADLVGEEGVGADQEVDGAVGQPGVEGGPLGGPVRLVSRATRSGRRPSRVAGSGTVSPSSSDGPRRRAARPAPRSGPSAAPWWPPWTAASMAATATTVLPDPTSPCRSRCMGSGPARSARMASMARRWAAVGEKGRPLEEPVHQGRAPPSSAG